MRLWTHTLRDFAAVPFMSVSFPAVNGIYGYLLPECPFFTTHTYYTKSPLVASAKMIIQAGIREVVFLAAKDPTHRPEYAASIRLLDIAGNGVLAVVDRTVLTNLHKRISNFALTLTSAYILYCSLHKHSSCAKGYCTGGSTAVRQRVCAQTPRRMVWRWAAMALLLCWSISGRSPRASGSPAEIPLPHQNDWLLWSNIVANLAPTNQNWIVHILLLWHVILFFLSTVEKIANSKIIASLYKGDFAFIVSCIIRFI